MQDYYGYILLDFVTADRDLEELPLAAALVLAEKLGLKDRFTEIAKRELRLRKKQLETIDQDKEDCWPRRRGQNRSSRPTTTRKRGTFTRPPYGLPGTVS